MKFNARQFILIGLGLLVVYGLVNFVANQVQTRSQLAQVASKEPARQEEGVRSLMQRGVLFDALQGGASKDVRLAAIATLARLAEDGKNPQAFKELLQMLKDPDTESVEAKTHPVRDAAKDAVAKVGLGYQDLLFAAAKDPDGNIRDQSRNALKQIGRPLKEEMAKRLEDKDLRMAMGDMLSSIGPETVPLITPYLYPPKLKADDNEYKTQLIEILGKFTVSEAATPILQFRDDPNPNVRRSAVTALANIAQPVGAPVLIKALSDPTADASARAAAAGALGGIATPEANAAMQKAISDFDVAVAVAATAGLRRAGDKAAANIAALLAHPEAAVRARAAEATGGMSDPTLAVRAFGDADAAVRARAIESIGDILARAVQVRDDLQTLAAGGDAAALEPALQSLQTRGAFLELARPANAAAKANAIALLNAQIAAEKDQAKRTPYRERIARLESPTVLPPLAEVNENTLAPLVRALSDADGTVAQNAVTAFGRIGEPAIPSLVRLIGNANEKVAYYASQALVRIGRVAVDPLLAAARAGQPTARWAAITLGEIGDGRAAEALQALTGSPDPDTAYVAQAALAKVRRT
ncbi:MAG: HEAT repeat domain-containing protein [Capsulimonadales bacterium]|nr:HEAT repeat domain-containing protein [Capsulimonadales bacterium]